MDDKTLIDGRIIENTRSKADNSGDLDHDNPLNAAILAQLTELENRLTAALVAQLQSILTSVHNLETRLEDRCREIHDRVALSSLPPGDPGEMNRQLLQQMQLQALELRRFGIELAELQKAPPGAVVEDPKVAELRDQNRLLSEQLQATNAQLVAMNERFNGIVEKLEKKDVPTTASDVAATEHVVEELETPRSRHRLI
jgi:molecular chaperone GrpE (heat shock protein)